MSRYDKAKADHETLCKMGNGHDLVEVDAECFELMADPTKKRACSMYESSIRFWFDEYGVSEKTQEIADRWLW